MKRMHVHLSVADLAESLSFYRGLFGAEPSVLKRDYAKWMLEDPRLNFAISTGHASTGLDHLGFQVDSSEELDALAGQVLAAKLVALPESGAQCCYSQSDKHWLTDPQGIVWEAFHSLRPLTEYGEKSKPPTEVERMGCCPPRAKPRVTLGEEARCNVGGGCC